MDEARYQRLFVEESRRHLDAIHQLLRKQSVQLPDGELRSQALLRHMHTIKGMASALHLERIVVLAHQLENQIPPLCKDRQSGRAALTQTVIDGLVTLDQLIVAFAHDSRKSHDAAADSAMERSHLIELTGEYVALVRAWGQTLNKDVSLALWGQQVELPSRLLTALHAPLVQLIRNAIDHGIETSYLRCQRGKPDVGSISLRAFQAPPGLRICVSDDGGGLDPKRIVERAVKTQFLTQQQADVLSTPEIYALLSRPGFSLAKEVTTFSGRGFGLDIVKVDLQRIGGVLEVASVMGRGSHFCCYIPNLDAT